MVKDLGARVYINLETFGHCSLTFLAPSVWNSLPAELKSANLHAHFRSLLKIHLFRLACLLYTSPSPRDLFISRMPSSA